jgi:hypothetical protein
VRTHLEFASTEFPAYESEDEEVNPGRFGKCLAEWLATTLPDHGFTVTGIDAEDWGWRVELENETFPLWIGCGNYEEFHNGFLCFIEPSKPFVRKWLSKIDTSQTVERLASALEAAVRQRGEISRLRWWSDDGART